MTRIAATVCAMALTLLTTPTTRLAAQQATPAPVEPPRPVATTPRATPQAVEPTPRWAPAQNVQLDVKITFEGNPSGPVSKSMRLVAGDRQTALGRSGVEVPVQTSVVVPNPSYRSVGLNVDARPQLQPDGKISLMLKLNFSSILRRESGESGPPSFSSSSTELNLVLDSGRPLVISQTSDGEVGRGYSVEVKATILK